MRSFWEPGSFNTHSVNLHSNSDSYQERQSPIICCCCSVAKSYSDSLQPHGLQQASLLCPPLSPAAAAAKSLQSCPTLCDPRDGSPPGSAIPGILQARTLEWVAIAFSNAWKWKVKVKSLSRVQLSATPWTATYQAPLSMGFSRQEYWSGVHCLLHKIRLNHL